MRRVGGAVAVMVVIAVAVGVGVGGCSRNGPEAPPPVAVVVADAAVAVAEQAEADAGPLTAWTDPGAVRALTKSCAFDPTMRGHGPLSCAFDFEQSCVPDPCEDERRETCAAECGNTCATCGQTCVTQCVACKAPCRDEACRRACAVSCGRCRQDCIGARDRCSTGHCGDEYKGCRARLVTSWITNRCDSVCAPFIACRNKCAERDKDGEDCTLTCYDKVPGARACKPNEMICEAMTYAAERREVDPKWKANGCDAVCERIWACARTACEKKGCGEAIKEFEGCRARTLKAGACGASTLLCPQAWE